MILPSRVYVRPDGSMVAIEAVSEEEVIHMSLADYTSYNKMMAESCLNERVEETAKFLVPAAFYPMSVAEAWGQSSNSRVRELSKHDNVVISQQELNTLRANLQKSMDQARKEPVKTTSKPAVTLTYTDYYWRYVDAKNPYVAAENLALMISHVTQTMEPAQRDSWVKDREVPSAKQVVKKHKTPFGLTGRRLVGYYMLQFSAFVIIGHLLAMVIH